MRVRVLDIYRERLGFMVFIERDRYWEFREREREIGSDGVGV